MIFGKNAEQMLKYQKAKAKMVEYNVSKQEYPQFRLNSNELSYPTTYVLSRYSECIIENNHEEARGLFQPLQGYYKSSIGYSQWIKCIHVYFYWPHGPGQRD